MYRSIGTVTLSVFILSPGLARSVRPSVQKIETVVGTVVAYQPESFLPCYHICRSSIIVRTDRPKSATPNYVRVVFEYPDPEFPIKLTVNTMKWRFKVRRTADQDGPLEEFWSIQNEKTGAESKIPSWKLLPGAEQEQLPFGTKMATYSLAQYLSTLVPLK